jgi:hypothetical protein
MQPIDGQFDEGRFRYTQIRRIGNLAIYTQEHRPSGIVRYEVIKIRLQREHTWPNGVVTPEKEAYPGSHAWGRDGWTFFRLPDAEVHLASLPQGPVLDAEPVEETEEDQRAHSNRNLRFRCARKLSVGP